MSLPSLRPPPAPTAAFEPQLGKYRLIAEIARGGMGIVYLAVVQGPGGFNKLSVVKELKPELAADPQFLDMFLDEARLAARLHHSNIVQTNEVGQEGHRYYIAMEYLEGRSLHRLLRKEPDALTRSMYLRVLSDVLSALDYAHELADYNGESLQVVHRDVNPHNVFLTYDGQIKLVDFGIAKAVDSSHETQAGILKGKVAYMAPEQALGEKVDRRSDIYAVGTMLAEAILEKRLWTGVTEIEILSRLVRRELPDIGVLKPDAPADLLRICRKAMSWNRADRYATAAEMRTDLETYMKSATETATAREIGLALGVVFADDRARIKSVVDANLARGNSDDGSFDINVPIPSMGSFAGMGSLSDSSLNRGSYPGRGSLSSVGSMSSMGTGSAQTQALNGVSGSLSTLEAPKKSPMGMIVGGVAIAAVALGIGLSMRKGDAPVAQAPAATTANAAANGAGAGANVAAASSAGGAAAAPTSISLRVEVDPPNAQLTLDGANVSGNPYTATFPRDGMHHILHASATGYVAKAEDVTFDRDVSVDMSLQALPQVIVRTVGRAARADAPAAVSAAPAAPATPGAPAAATVGPAGGHAPTRNIDPANPYGQ